MKPSLQKIRLEIGVGKMNKVTRLLVRGDVICYEGKLYEILEGPYEVDCAPLWGFKLRDIETDVSAEFQLRVYADWEIHGSEA